MKKQAYTAGDPLFNGAPLLSGKRKSKAVAKSAFKG